MSQSSPITKIIVVVLLAGVVPSLVSMAAHFLVGKAPHLYPSLHEFIELVGACIALGVAALLLLSQRQENVPLHLMWVAASLVGMGIVDGIHSLLPVGLPFSWTRHGATFVGGLLFALVWLPPPRITLAQKQLFIVVVAAFALIGALAICRWPERLPAAWVGGEYSDLVIIVNVLGGAGFLVASLFFIRRYFCYPQIEDLVFVCQTLLFAVAGIFFGLSHVWAADWWVWHVFRLIAYMTVLYVVWKRLVTDIEARIHAAEVIQKLNDDLQRQALELEVVNRELEAFSYSVSHDLKAPLRSMAGFARMLEEDYGQRLDEEGRRLLKVVRDSARDMGQLISDLLTFSRLSRKELQKVRVNVRDLVEEARQQVENAEPGRKLNWEIGDLPPVFADEVTLREVLINLLANAVKFTRPRPEAVIRIEGCTEGAEVVYTVRDNGVGFDMAYKDKLFCVFQRLHTTDEFEGTGIGLALVQRIIQRHGGRVWADGKVNEGATFCFALPIESQEKGKA